MGEGFGMCQAQFIYCALYLYFCSLVAQLVKSLPAVWETQVQPLGWEDLLKKEMTAHSSILAWRIQWTEEPARLQKAGHGWVTEHLFLVWFHQLRLRSSGIRSLRLGAPALVPSFIFYTAPACFLLLFHLQNYLPSFSECDWVSFPHFLSSESLLLTGFPWSPFRHFCPRSC